MRGASSVVAEPPAQHLAAGNRFDDILRGAGLWDAAVHGGLLRSWFDDFQCYWHGGLGGWPITLWDSCVAAARRLDR